MVTESQAGRYWQLSHRLRIARGPGVPDRVSERPRDRDSGRYLDYESPTVVEFEVGDLVDVPSLLAIGAIAPADAPHPSPPTPVTPRSTRRRSG